MPQGWTPVPEAPAAAAGWTPVAEPATFSTTNEKDEQGNAVVSGVGKVWNTLNTPLIPQIADAAHAIAAHIDAPALDRSETIAHIRGFFSGATEGAGDLAAGMTSPVGIALTLATAGEGAIVSRLPALKSIFALSKVKALQRAVQATAGVGFGVHGAERVVNAPTLAEKAQGVAEMASGALGVVGAMPQGQRAPVPAAVAAADDAAVQFGLQRGIPVDAATATNNRFVKSAQGLADHSPIGSVVAERARTEQAKQLTRVGGELADQVRGAAVTPEQAGAGTRDALASKAQAHSAMADAQYEALRAMEADPANHINVPLPKEAVDHLPDTIKGQLRRIVHEMDAAPYSKRLLKPADKGGGLEHVEGTGGAGAAVFDDIVGRMDGTSSPTRGAIQEDLEAFLAGGKETNAVTAALKVAKERSIGRGGATVTKPEMPPSAMDVPTRHEGARVTTQDMGLPVYTATAKDALRPVYEQMTHQMPLTQQQANPGLKAIKNILEGPDWAPLSQVDTDLSAIKALAREKGGLAKLAVAKLDAVVREAAKDAGPHVERALEQGRSATIAKVGTDAFVKALPGGKMQEPTAVFKRATAPGDAGIEFLRKIRQQTPQVVPQIARATLDGMLQTATERGRFDHADKLYADWQKLGSQTKAILYPQPGLSEAIGHFFLLAKKIAESPNPSQSGLVVNAGGQMVLAVTNPVVGVPVVLGSGALSKLLHSRTGAQAITRLLQAERPSVLPAAVRVKAHKAAWVNVVTAARSAGVPMDQLPMAADASPDTTKRPENK